MLDIEDEIALRFKEGKVIMMPSKHLVVLMLEMSNEELTVEMFNEVSYIRDIATTELKKRRAATKRAGNHHNSQLFPNKNLLTDEKS